MGAVMWEQLTRREKQVAELILEACDKKEIAAKLLISPRTVKSYFRSMFVKFAIRDGIKHVKLAVMLYREREIRALKPK
jgi:DNA-binding NarL/FixJ family response regulator